MYSLIQAAEKPSAAFQVVEKLSATCFISLPADAFRGHGLSCFFASFASLSPGSSARALPAGVAAFCSISGLAIHLLIPPFDHSTISFNRKGRFENTTILEEIFEETVRQAQSHGLVSGRVLLSDSTHVKANANKSKFIPKAKSKKVGSFFMSQSADILVT